MNELQWIGLIVKPIDYSMKGAVLHIDTGPGLKIEETHMIEIEDHTNNSKSSVNSSRRCEQILLESGKIELPNWASDITTVVWFPVRAIDDRIARGVSAGLLLTTKQGDSIHTPQKFAKV